MKTNHWIRWGELKPDHNQEIIIKLDRGGGLFFGIVCDDEHWPVTPERRAAFEKHGGNWERDYRRCNPSRFTFYGGFPLDDHVEFWFGIPEPPRLS